MFGLVSLNRSTFFSKKETPFFFSYFFLLLVLVQCLEKTFLNFIFGQLRKILSYFSKLSVTTVTVSCMVSLTRKCQKFNMFRTRPLGWLQKQGERITSRKSSASFTGCLCPSVSFLRCYFLLTKF